MVLVQVLCLTFCQFYC